MSWTIHDIGDLHGRVALVTGANTGIGRATAEALAAHGTTVVLACRDLAKAERTAAAIRMSGAARQHRDKTKPDPVWRGRDARTTLNEREDLASATRRGRDARASLSHGQYLATTTRRGRDARTRLNEGEATTMGEVVPLHIDLASLRSVRAAAERFRDRFDRLDLLINNAGVMVPPYTITEDGFELQIGVNHLGHFALTGLLLDRLIETEGSRVVTVSSVGHRRGVIDFADLHSRRRYEPLTAYNQSKLANLLFAFALDRRLRGTTTRSLAAHPGAARTELMRHSPWHFRFVVSRRTRWLFSWLIQDEDRAALPTLRAATDPGATDYFGPSGWREFTGTRAVPARPHPKSRDLEVQERLWAESERLTGVTFDAKRGAPR
ncbi:oxidoreductase [Asanoa sp. NPDC050611]|uniref:oxidoreductase n=1 Tax=Asanoa sp. NPDC050611 TaxID=3157098 RepID=UPI0033D13410